MISVCLCVYLLLVHPFDIYIIMIIIYYVCIFICKLKIRQLMFVRMSRRMIQLFMLMHLLWLAVNVSSCQKHLVLIQRYHQLYQYLLKIWVVMWLNVISKIIMASKHSMKYVQQYNVNIIIYAIISSKYIMVVIKVLRLDLEMKTKY